MMNVLPARGTDLPHLHPFIFGESRWNDLIGVFDVASRRDENRLRHLDDPIRLLNVPALGPLPLRRRVVRIPGPRPAVDPGSYDLDLIGRQRWIVRKMSVPRVGKPGRHLSNDPSLTANE